MLAKKEIEKLIIQEKIVISYSFMISDDKVDYIGEQSVVIGDETNNATKLFNKNFFCDRLKLTLGPIVMTHDDAYINVRPTFKNRRSCFDIRENNNKLIIEPRETLSISTNEKIKLGKNIGAYILPRLRNVDSGILYVPSYIDPYWNGILQAVLVNMTDNQQILHLGEGVAICRFYYIKGTINDDVHDLFPSKSHHFGQSWPKILEEDADPFPRRKTPFPKNAFECYKKNIKDFFRKRWSLLINLGLTSSVIILVGYFSSLYTEIERLKLIDKDVKKIENSFNDFKNVTISKIEKDVVDISERLPKSGTVSIFIEGKKTLITQTIEIINQSDIPKTVWFEILNDRKEIKIISYKTDTSLLDNKILKIILELESQSKEDLNVAIKWFITNQ
jgi:deoxycytidine triphosphate deaminase